MAQMQRNGHGIAGGLRGRVFSQQYSNIKESRMKFINANKPHRKSGV
jgi:hypothetical protein